ncbi:hypothetical protein A1O1_05308 [Capronia coronata CBS 617.96]|uniref:Uncharacterized protein n=1 Tax=Capronia coronata CBS 617.96 TaxID=1182541 RepID=W9Y798_9EURO|nr:uncharacterized protein A1O1_05308 [Capronia coronata CBS 617.96]EXJ88378.1 hypothetical protein A1O1_05308 [Capronia coronata CBS 617.96]
MPHLLARVAGYIDYYQTNQPGFDDEPRIHPIEGTVMDDPMRDDNSDDNGLLEYQSDDESDNEDPLKSLQHLTAYWKPRCGDITVLLPMYAQEITRLTGTDIFAEEAEKRCRLYQGDFNLAGEKLLRLEPLLETFKKQRDNESLTSSGNLLVWPPQEKDAKMQFVHITSEHPAYSRVIVNKMEQTLFRKVIGEIRPCTRSFDYELPANLYLDGISPTSEVQASRVWDGFLFHSFGNPGNMDPIISSNPASADNSDRGTVKDPDEERIAAWTTKVVGGADPEIAPEVPVEPTHPTRRRVVLDSDSEDDEPSVRMGQSQLIGSQAMKAPQQSEMPRNATPEPPSDLLSLLSSPARSVSNQVMGSLVDKDSIQKDLLDDPTASPKVAISQNVGLESPSDLVSLVSDSPHSTTKPATGSTSITTTAEYNGLANQDLLSGDSPPRVAAHDNTSTRDRVAITSHSSNLPTSIVEDQLLELSSTEPLPGQTLTATDMPASLSLAAGTAEPKAEHAVQSAAPTPPLSTPATPPQADAAASSSPRPTFDPKAYGGPSPKLRRGQNVHLGSREGTNPRYRASTRGGRGQTSGGSYSQAVSRGQHPIPRGPQLQRGSNIRRPPIVAGSASSDGDLGGRAESRQSDLVDTRSPTTNTSPRIPPGFESHVPLVRAQPSPGSQPQTSNSVPNIMDEPIQPPGYAPHPRDSRSRSGTHASGESRIRFSNEGADYQATHVPKLNQAVLRERSLQAAMAAVEARRNAQGQASANKKAEDEEKPAVHSTMRQQGKNPGKKPVKQETKAEAAARRAQALLDAHGPVPAKAPPKPESSNSQSEPMSTWKKRQIRKNTTIADGHPEIVEDITRKRQCDKLIPQLEPLFEICRAFNGRVSFEVAFGQVLIFPGPRLSDQQYHNVIDWEDLFEPKPTRTPCTTTFTKILTTNGADVDRALELKGPSTGANVKLWNTTPAHQSVSYEFSCQSRSNEDFLILVDESGKHELRKGLVTVGMINMHVPAQIWDASAILSGHLKWFEPPEVLKKSAATFVNSLYIVPEREKLMIVFRQPNDHEVQIRNLIVKRVTFHACNLAGYEDIQLKVVESKSLMFKVHPQDKKLWQGYEGTKEEYEQLSQDGRIHYEMSLVHTGINQVLAQNEELVIGELTPAETTGQSLVDRAAIRSLLDIAVHMLSKIDFVGMHNFGTQLRLDVEEERRRKQLEASLGPKGKSILHAPTRIGVPPVSRLHHPNPASHMSGAGAGAGGGGFGSASQIATTIKPPVHGVRLNTVAEVFEDVDGSRYMLGMGGARIPVAEEALPSASTVMPDDSASQVGGRQAKFYAPWSAESPRIDGFW